MSDLEKAVQEAKRAALDSPDNSGDDQENEQRAFSVGSEDDLAGGLEDVVMEFSTEYLPDSGPVNKRAKKMVAKATEWLFVVTLVCTVGLVGYGRLWANGIRVEYLPTIHHIAACP